LQRIREKIANDDVVLSYTLRDSKLIIWVVRKTHAALQVVDADDIRRQMALFYGSASDSGEFELGPPGRLYELAISPIASELNDVHQMFIEADQEASAVPFAALIELPPPSLSWNISLDWTPAWLIQRFAISRVPSLAGFAWESDRVQSPPRPLLAAGNPNFGREQQAPALQPCASAEDADANLGNAPDAPEELENAMSIAGPGRATLLAFDDFSREKLRRAALSDFGIIVFATHGLPETNSQPARLILSGPRGAAKALTASDVETFDLSADLVILSACDSGLRSGARIGLNDLVPAFFAAGARHVVATSWPLAGPVAKEITSHLVSANSTTTIAILRVPCRRDCSRWRIPRWARRFVIPTSGPASSFWERHDVILDDRRFFAGGCSLAVVRERSGECGGRPRGEIRDASGGRLRFHGESNANRAGAAA
jgi:CHAT domain-containing protein